MLNEDLLNLKIKRRIAESGWEKFSDIHIDEIFAMPIQNKVFATLIF